MKAVVRRSFGEPDVVQVEELAKPTVDVNDVLIRVEAAGLNPADIFMMRGQPFPVRLMGAGLFKPRSPILGADFVGIIEDMGKNVAGFTRGDRVIGDLSSNGFGSFAEYTLAPSHLLAHAPSNVSVQEAAILPMASVTALQGLRIAMKGRSTRQDSKGQRVLVVGAAGGIGLFAAQIAKAWGFDVTAVASDRHHATIASVGIERVIDHRVVDVTSLPERFDIILDTAGVVPHHRYRSVMTPQATYLLFGGPGLFGVATVGRLRSRSSGRRYITFLATPSAEDLSEISGLVGSNALRPLVRASFELNDARAAFEYQTSGQGGKCVITMM
jgi:NADPH:quinone reductase-like Zn-dependent oxidoreductase